MRRDVGDLVALAARGQRQHLPGPVRVEAARVQQFEIVGAQHRLDELRDQPQFAGADRSRVAAGVDREERRHHATGDAGEPDHLEVFGRHAARRVEAQQQHRRDRRCARVGRDQAELFECAGAVVDRQSVLAAGCAEDDCVEWVGFVRECEREQVLVVEFVPELAGLEGARGGDGAFGEGLRDPGGACGGCRRGRGGGEGTEGGWSRRGCQAAPQVGIPGLA
ncbi:MAG: hypothetical protein WAT39_19170 [Planctomycetota bacterium]